MGSSAVAGTGTPLCEGGLWSIDLAARPSKLLLLTLQKLGSEFKSSYHNKGNRIIYYRL